MGVRDCALPQQRVAVSDAQRQGLGGRARSVVVHVEERERLAAEGEQHRVDELNVLQENKTRANTERVTRCRPVIEAARERADVI